MPDRAEIRQTLIDFLENDTSEKYGDLDDSANLREGLGLGVQKGELFVFAAAAERTPQPRRLPARRTQTTAQPARLLQTAELGQQRPTAASRTVTTVPRHPLTQWRHLRFQGRERRKQN